MGLKELYEVGGPQSPSYRAGWSAPNRQEESVLSRSHRVGVSKMESWTLDLQ